jgi:hypothetical protein
MWIQSEVGQMAEEEGLCHVSMVAPCVAVMVGVR